MMMKATMTHMVMGTTRGQHTNRALHTMLHSSFAHHMCFWGSNWYLPDTEHAPKEECLQILTASKCLNIL